MGSPRQMLRPDLVIVGAGVHVTTQDSGVSEAMVVVTVRVVRDPAGPMRVRVTVRKHQPRFAFCGVRLKTLVSDSAVSWVVSMFMDFCVSAAKVIDPMTRLPVFPKGDTALTARSHVGAIRVGADYGDLLKAGAHHRDPILSTTRNWHSVNLSSFKSSVVLQAFN